MKAIKSLCFSAIIFLLLLETLQANSIWPRPTIIPLPETTTGVANPSISLDGTWKFTMTPPSNFWLNTINPSAWHDLEVPGEPWMQGFHIIQDVEYPYKKQISIPADYSGKKIFLRFDGVYSNGRVWVNGTFVGEHYGGFTSWNVDITDHVSAGQTAWVTVGVTDYRNDLSFASGYAARYRGAESKHLIGGIIRGVTLFAVPDDHITRLHVNTDLDSNYVNADLTIKTAVAFNGAANATLNLTLLDPQGTAIALSNSVINVTSTTPENSITVLVVAPKLWDAEHPNLYTLNASLNVGGSTVQTLSKKIGFREIEVVGPNVLVNGKEIKLRGGNRHSIHPLKGRAYAPEIVETDVLLYKEANLNYVRTSHYPTSEKYLEMADKYGLYVEEEAAIVWLDHGASSGVLNGISSDPAKLPWFMSNISEMLERDLSHPSIIIWSLGNENTQWGTNFETERNYARLEDPSRPLKTGHNHYSGGWNTSAHTDLDSYHYPSWNSNFSSTTKPWIWDEWVHVIAYHEFDFDKDPNVRNFWGESIKTFWDTSFQANGSLGGALWGTVDDIFLEPSPGVPNGYGRWGIFDGWRRKKTEFWHSRKAHSPVRITNTTLTNPGPGNTLSIPVKNWFDHTNFSELTITWSVGNESGNLYVNLDPHNNGTLVVPGRLWKNGDLLNLKFISNHNSLPNFLVDEFNLPVGPILRNFPGPGGSAPSITNNPTDYTINGSNFSLVFSKSTGLIERGTYNGDVILTGGPSLNLDPYGLSAWSLTRLNTSTVGNQVWVDISGSHGSINVSYVLKIDGNGLIETTYTITNPPTTSSMYNEVGVSFYLSDTVEQLNWERKGLWSIYPEDHLGRNKGTTAKVRTGGNESYRVKPTWSWSQDMKDFHTNGINDPGAGMTKDYRGMKEYIYFASAVIPATNNRLRVESSGIHAVRMNLGKPNEVVIDDRDASLNYFGAWNLFSDTGDLNGTESYSGVANTYVEHTFTGTSIEWVSAKNSNLGIADVYLDNVLVAKDVDAYASSKQHKQVLYSVTGLSNTQHTIRIQVTGNKNPSASAAYIIIDGFKSSLGLAQKININSKWAYQLGWGNYQTSSSINSGFSDTVKMRLTNNDNYSSTP